MSQSGEVWSATIDQQTWRAEVKLRAPEQGELIVTRIADGEVILREQVPLAYGAIFGPDVDDVNLWKVMAIEAVDHYNAKHHEGEQHA